MSTLTDHESRQQMKFQRAYRPTSAVATAVRFDEDLMHVSLADGRIISAPIVWFPLLLEATPEQRNRFEIHGGGVSLHWPDIDEDLPVAGLLDGADWRST